MFTDFRPLTKVSRDYLFFGGEGGWRIHISLAAILEGVHMDEVEHDIMNYQNLVSVLSAEAEGFGR